MSDYFYSEIRIFAGNYVPQDWAACNGALLSISSNETLFSLIGTVFGGSGVVDFALPDMRGRLPVHKGSGPGLTPRTLGASFGTETVTLNTASIPSHSHTLQALNLAANTNVPTNNLLGTVSTPYTIYDDLNATATTYAMAAGSVFSYGYGLPHDNIMPSLPLTFMICVQNGIYPERNN
jgi:microcystin-dependent protein